MFKFVCMDIVFENLALANQHIRTKIGQLDLEVTYDNQGRLVEAECNGFLPGQNKMAYSARLKLELNPPSGFFGNSYGDRVYWQAGVEESSSSFGTWEQFTRTNIEFEEWVERMLKLMTEQREVKKNE